MKKKLVSN